MNSEITRTAKAHVRACERLSAARKRGWNTPETENAMREERIAHHDFKRACEAQTEKEKTK